MVNWTISNWRFIELRTTRTRVPASQIHLHGAQPSMISSHVCVFLVCALQMCVCCVLVTDSLIYSSLCDVSATVQPDVDDPPAEILVPGHQVHSVAQLCRTENTEQDADGSVCRLLQQWTSSHSDLRFNVRICWTHSCRAERPWCWRRLWSVRVSAESPATGWRHNLQVRQHRWSDTRLPSVMGRENLQLSMKVSLNYCVGFVTRIFHVVFVWNYHFNWSVVI